MKDKLISCIQQQTISSKEGWIILFDGERLVMNSGKLIWKERHHALNALIGSIKDISNYSRTRENNIEMQEIVKQLVLEGRIEIKYYPEYKHYIKQVIKHTHSF